MNKAVIDSGSQFYQDLIDESKTLNVNSSQMSRGYYNLVLSIRDCSLYSKGIKPHRFWKITDVKNYFKVKGTASDIAEQLRAIQILLTTKTIEK
jgi:hypothetical protein